jgi:hypothetical protein
MSLAEIVLRQAVQSGDPNRGCQLISGLDGNQCDNREAIVRHLKMAGRTPATGDWRKGDLMVSGAIVDDQLRPCG